MLYAMNGRQSGRAAGGVVSAASHGRAAGANDRLGMALVGSGRRGREVMGAFPASGRAELRCLRDVDDVQRQRALQALVKSGNAPHRCVAHEEALARSDAAAVVIATPDHLHVSLGVAALETGKHVCPEKPATHQFTRRRALREAARKSGKLLQCGARRRSGEHYIRAKEEIFGKNRRGRVAIVRTAWSDFPWQTRRIPEAPKPAGLDWERFLGSAPKRPYQAARYDSWRWFPDCGGGLPADILTHRAGVASTCGGIYVMRDGRENPGTVSAILQYAPGWTLTFESSVLPLKAGRPAVLFPGAEGMLDIDRGGYTLTPSKGEPQTVRFTGSLERAHAGNFPDAVIKGARPNAPIEAGIEACSPVHLANASYRRGRRMEWKEYNEK
jgi:predicted dehydrogenase